MKKRNLRKFNADTIFGTLSDKHPVMNRWTEKELKTILPKAVLLPFQVDKKHLKNVLTCMQLMDVMGLLVEGKHKKNIVKHLPMLDEIAKHAKTVDTIIRTKQSFKGINSQGLACLKWLEDSGIKKADHSNAIVVGKSTFFGPVIGALKAKEVKARHIKTSSGITVISKKRIPKIVVIGNLDTSSTKKLFLAIKNSCKKTLIIDLREASRGTKMGFQTPCLKLRDILNESLKISVKLLTKKG